MVVNLENAFKFLFKDKKWLIKVLIGGALIWIPIVNFLVFGYLLKILGDAKDKKEPVLPEWTDWAVLFQDGFMAFIVILCYGVLLIPLFILGLIPIIGRLFQLAGLFLLYPVVGVALCFYLEKKELTAAFDFKAIIEKIKLNIVDYSIITLLTGVLAALLGVGSFFVLFFVLVSLILIPIIPLIIVPLMSISFYLSVVAFRLYGEVFSTSK